MLRTPFAALWPFLVIPLSVLGGGGKEKGRAPGDEPFLALRKEYLMALKGTEGNDEKKRKLVSAYATRFFALATKIAKDEAAADALLWILINAPESPKVAEAALRLQKQHLQSPRLKPKLPALRATAPEVEQFLRSVLTKNTDRDTQAVACYALAQLLREKAGADHPKIRQEAIRFLDLCVTKYGDCSLGNKGPTLGARCRPLLFEMRRLVIGKVVPDIAGVDFDGKKFKLSDYRGKVVMLSYWATWCPYCMKMVPHERALVQRLEGKPFVLIGVNGDPNGDKKKVMLRINKERITWRSFWGGDAIAAQWNVEYWPAIFIIDHNGIIRHRLGFSEDADELNRAIDPLVAAAKKSAGKKGSAK